MQGGQGGVSWLFPGCVFRRICLLVQRNELGIWNALRADVALDAAHNCDSLTSVGT